MLADLKLIRAVERLVGAVKVRPAPQDPPAAAAVPPSSPAGRTAPARPPADSLPGRTVAAAVG